MKANKFVRSEQQTVSRDLAADPRKSFNIQIEYNVPFSKLNPRCEKENLHANQSLQTTTLQEEEMALQRDQEKKQKAAQFFDKIKASSKQILQKQKQEKALKAEEKRKEQERIMFKTSKPRILPQKKSPKKKAPVPEPEESAVEPNLDYSMQSKALTDQSVSEEIHNLSSMNPETALQKNGIIRNHMASLSRFNTSIANQSSISFFKTGRE